MEKISLKMGVMWWWEQACEKHGTNVSPELRKAVQHTLLAMPFMQADPTMRGLCVSAFSDFIDHEWRSVCILFYLLGKYGLRIEMSEEEMDEYEGKAVPKADNIDWEQRRWELAVRIFMEAPYNPIEQTTIESLNKADIFIRQYRQILNKEEQL